MYLLCACMLEEGHKYATARESQGETLFLPSCGSKNGHARRGFLGQCFSHTAISGPQGEVLERTLQRSPAISLHVHMRSLCRTGCRQSSAKRSTQQEAPNTDCCCSNDHYPPTVLNSGST